MRAAMAIVAVTIAIAACGGGDHREVGVVIDVDGGLSAVTSFEILTEDGSRLRFTPADDLRTFAHGGPLTHLTDHLRTGAQVRVSYNDGAAGLVAFRVEDVEP